MPASLRIMNGKYAGQTLSITRSILIGRADDCELKVNIGGISRHHCRLELVDGRLFVRDLKSRNGTILNDEKVEGRREIFDGDRLRIETLEFEAHVPVEKIEKPAEEDIWAKDSSLDELLETLSGWHDTSTSVVLKVTEGVEQGDRISIHEKEFLIGREVDCRWRPKSTGISRYHCIIRINDAEVTVEDLQSRNGTFINGERISDRVPLADGDQLGLGRMKMDVRIRSIGDSMSTTLGIPGHLSNALSQEISGNMAGDTQLDGMWLEELKSELQREGSESGKGNSSSAVEDNLAAETPTKERNGDLTKDAFETTKPGKLPRRITHDASEAATDVFDRVFTRKNENREEESA